ncbi:MAG: hypothetical protein SPLM_10490 [Spiroplasma phoeniceum]|uniref:hypothetical protein n=1 Tax=Spiroplasma phoeniceum TaxID=47835 RepID=UPI003133F15E
MKKILSLLSVLTISGTAMPYVIANSEYKKNEEIKNNEFKINELKREKRGLINFNSNGQVKFDINNIWKNKNIPVMPLSLFGVTGNNGPDKWEIFRGLKNANYSSFEESFNALKNAHVFEYDGFLNVTNIYKNSAYISAKPNTPYTGGFWVYY